MTAKIPPLDFQALPIGLKQARFFIQSKEQSLKSGIAEDKELLKPRTYI